MTKKIAAQDKRRSAVLPEDRQQLAHVEGGALLADLLSLIHAARQRLASAANATHTLLCWQVGRRLLRENLQEGRAAYGKQILATVSQVLSWSHFIELLPIKAPLARDFYAEMCRIERWDVRTLRQAIEHAREQEARRLPVRGEQP